jgi:hypothetical protein
MKMITNRFMCALVGFFLLTLTIGCEKGEDGIPGKDGSANVESRTFSASSWNYSSPYYYLELSVPELTASNIHSTAVMAYFSIDGSNWRAVPYTQYNTPSNYFMGCISSVGNVRITWFYDSSLSSGDNPNVYYGTTVKLKVVVIPVAAKIINPNIDYKNYEEVRAAFHLQN